MSWAELPVAQGELFSGLAQGLSPTDKEKPLDDAFGKHTFPASNGLQLPYRLLRPEQPAADKKYPLVLFLHGAGERGSDNQAQLKWCVRDFAAPAVRKNHPAFVVVPQCPADGLWVDRSNWKDPLPLPPKPAKPLAAVMELLDRLLAGEAVDPLQALVVGLSMGGYATWELLARRPTAFAAAVPICGGGDPAKAATFKETPIWAFHGAKDSVVPVSASRTMVEALQKAQAPAVKYTEYPNVEHNSWSPAFKEAGLLPWLFAQCRR